MRQIIMTEFPSGWKVDINNVGGSPIPMPGNGTESDVFTNLEAAQAWVDSKVGQK